jgi:hypothetical protein
MVRFQNFESKPNHSILIIKEKKKTFDYEISSSNNMDLTLNIVHHVYTYCYHQKLTKSTKLTLITFDLAELE